MELSKYFPAAPKFRPQLNLGCLHDIPTGRYYTGRRGESILNGGLQAIELVVGRGNTHKSGLAHWKTMTILARYSKIACQAYDTEVSATIARFVQLSTHIEPTIDILALEDEGRFHLTDVTVINGSDWFTAIRRLCNDKIKESKQYTMTTPFNDPDSGQPFKMLLPTLSEIDSLSMFETDAVEQIRADTKPGESKANMVDMRAASGKSQMFMQLPQLTGKARLYLNMTGHVGTVYQLDQYNPVKPQLIHMKGDVKIKNVPEKANFLTNILWYVVSNRVLQNKANKAALYPRPDVPDKEGDTDLQAIAVAPLRSKAGASGMPFEVLVSQNEGILPSLSEFHFLMTHNKFGITGNDRNYALDLLPDVSLSRTVVRGKIDTNPALRRALQITSELCQIQQLWDDPEGLFCSPATLYADLKAQGYDWNELLATRGYWVFEEDEAGLPPFLSTMDLLKMRKGLYKPYWQSKPDSDKSSKAKKMNRKE